MMIFYRKLSNSLPDGKTDEKTSFLHLKRIEYGGLIGKFFEFAREMGTFDVNVMLLRWYSN